MHTKTFFESLSTFLSSCLSESKRISYFGDDELKKMRLNTPSTQRRRNQLRRSVTTIQEEDPIKQVKNKSILSDKSGNQSC